MNIEAVEQQKYESIWKFDSYRQTAPGEVFVDFFMEITQAQEGDKVIDFGAGTGRAALGLQKRGLDVYAVDIAENCLDPEPAAELKRPLILANLWKPLELAPVKYGFSSDVLEHIPPEHVAWQQLWVFERRPPP